MRCRYLLILILLIGSLILPTISVAQAEKAFPPCTANDYLQIIFAFSASGIAEKMTALTEAGNTGDALAILAAWRDIDEVFVNSIDPNIPECVETILVRESMALAFSQQAVLPSLVVLYEKSTSTSETGEMAQQMLREVGPRQIDLMDANLDEFIKLATQLQNRESLSWLPACSEKQREFALQLDRYEQAYVDEADALLKYVNNGTIEGETYVSIFRLLTELNEQLVEGNGACGELYRRTNEITVRLNNTFIALNIGLMIPYAEGSDDDAMVNELRDYYNERLELYLLSAALYKEEGYPISPP